MNPAHQPELTTHPIDSVRFDLEIPVRTNLPSLRQ